jgi:hypothetical protein
MEEEKKSKGIKRKRYDEEKIFDPYKYCKLHPEEFKKHPDYDYEISNKGRYRKIKTPDKINNGCIREDGYVDCGIIDKKKKKKRKSHGLVIETFYGPKPSPEMTVHHIDENRDNNCICNLMYASPSEQIQHRDNSNCKGRPKPMIAKHKDGSVMRFGSMNETADHFKIHTETIRKAMERDGFINQGYKFYFEESNNKSDIESKEWKVCDELSNEIKVSTDGYILLPSGILSRGTLHASGYRVIGTKEGQKSVHFLVLSTFKPNKNWRELKLSVNHIDGNKENNHISNLEWQTSREQVIQAQGRAVEMWTMDRKTLLKTFRCIADAAIEVGIHASCISKVCRKKLESAKGYYWKYVDEE